MNRKVQGFTLIELIVVVIIIGLLATIAVPQYLKATERALGAKAKNALGLIALGEKMYRADKDTYVDFAATGANAALGTYEELSDVDADAKWAYKVTGSSTTAFLATATRTGGSNNNETITLDQSGTWVDGFTP